MARQSLILASGSPRRREFMERLGLPFIVRVTEVDERSQPGERPQELVGRLSRDKALHVAADHPQATVIGADTIVTLDGELLGKPSSPSEATEMLVRLRNRPHKVYSGVTVASADSDTQTVVVESTVWMRDYSDGEIARYVAGGSPLEPRHRPARLREGRVERLVADAAPANPSMDVIERAYIAWVLQAEGGNKTRAAEVLGIDPSTLYRKLNRYGIEP